MHIRPKDRLHRALRRGLLPHQKKVRSLKHLAEMFAVDPQDYLRLLWQYDGWYQKLTEVSYQVAAGSHVPVPHDSELVRSSGKETSTGSEAAPRKTPTRKSTATASTKGPRISRCGHRIRRGMMHHPVKAV
jgi:hypothetical protein